VVTLLRVYTNQESVEGYYLLFKSVFEMVSRVLGEDVYFQSIHQQGIEAIVVDMDSRQYTGKWFGTAYELITN
jgi:hypothetical protein